MTPSGKGPSISVLRIPSFILYTAIHMFHFHLAEYLRIARGICPADIWRHNSESRAAAGILHCLSDTALEHSIRCSNAYTARNERLMKTVAVEAVEEKNQKT